MAPIMLRTVKRTSFRTALLLAMPALAVWVVWWPCLSGGFIRDDIPYVVENPAVVSPTPIAEVLLGSFPAQADLGLWRPLTTLSLRADQCLAAMLGREIPDPLVPHITNLLLVALAALLLAELAKSLGWSRLEASVAGTFFAVAAVRAESVCWISGRAECLLVVAALTTLVASARSTRLWCSVGAAGLGTALCILAKEQGFMLPLLLWFLPGSRREKLIRTGFALAVAGLCLALRWHVLGAFGPAGVLCVLREHGLVERALFAFQWLGDYGALVLWPFRLNNDYDPPAPEPLFLSLLAAVFTLKLLLRATRRSDAHRLAALLFLLPLLPVLNLFTRTGETFAERFLALPLAGAALLLVPRATTRRWQLALPLLLILMQAPLALRQAFAWRSEAALVEAMSEQGASEASIARRRAYIERRETVLLGADVETSTHFLRSATAHLETAHARVPFDRETTLDLAKLIKQAAAQFAPPARPVELARAEALVREVLAAEPDLAHAHAVLGEILAEEQRPAEARTAFARALELAPADTQALEWWLSLVPAADHSARQRQIRETSAALHGLAAQRPFDPLPSLALARVLQEWDPSAARVHAEEALRRARAPLARAAAAAASASILARLGEHGAAKALLQRIHDELLDANANPRADSRVQRLDALRQVTTLLGRHDEALRWLDERIRWTTDKKERSGLESERRMLRAR